MYMKKLFTIFLLICCACTVYSSTQERSLTQEHSAIQDSSIQKQLDDLNDNLNDIVNNLNEKYMKRSEVENYIWRICAWIIGAIILVLIVFIVGLYALYEKLSKLVKEERKQRKTDFYKLKEDTSDIVDQAIKKKLKPIREEIKEDILREQSSSSMRGAVECVKDVAFDTQDNVSMQEYEDVYAKPSGNDLKEVSESRERFYIIHRSLQNETKGTFTIYEKREQIQRLIDNKEDVLDPFCEAKNGPSNAIDIHTDSVGEVERLEGRIWKVTKKAKIEFIKE